MLHLSILLVVLSSAHAFPGLLTGLPPFPERKITEVSLITDPYAVPSQCVHSVLDQGRCTGWAMVAAQVLSDRYCLKHLNYALSPQDLLSCSIHTCANVNQTYPVWKYLEQTGIVKESCMPYQSWTGFNYQCPTACANKKEPWLKFSCAKGSLVHITSQKVEDIKKEIQLNGPVMAQMNVYLDFIYHKKGIYEHKNGQYLGRHVVRCYGYGSENGTNYWQCANTWSYNWGEQGVFKIKMGECGIESDIWACSPDKPKLIIN